MWVHMHVFVRLEDSIRHLPQLLSTLLLRQGLSLNLELGGLPRLWEPSAFTTPLPPVLRLQTCVASLRFFYVGAQVPCVCMIRTSTELSPQPERPFSTF